jgi:hypothetical protein
VIRKLWPAFPGRRAAWNAALLNREHAEPRAIRICGAAFHAAPRPGNAQDDADGAAGAKEPARQIEFVVAPARVEPGLRHQEQNGFAPRRRLIERPLPALARRDADLRIGIDVEKDVGPAF